MKRIYLHVGQTKPDVTKLKSDSTKQQNELKAMDQKVTSVYRSLIFRIYRKLRRLFGKKD